MIEEGFAFYFIRKAKPIPKVDRFCQSYDFNDVEKILQGDAFAVNKSYLKKQDVWRLL